VIAFFDSSVLLRAMFRESGAFADWKRIMKVYCSRLLEVEVQRVCDRRRLTGDLDDEGVALCKETLNSFLADAHVVMISEAILVAAQSPMNTVVRTLDAIHLATAVAVRRHEPSLVFLSHDDQQNLAARSLGLSAKVR
jgi:predicted nucleic acid-binding protein